MTREDLKKYKYTQEWIKDRTEHIEEYKTSNYFCSRNEGLTFVGADYDLIFYHYYPFPLKSQYFFPVFSYLRK